MTRRYRKFDQDRCGPAGVRDRKAIARRSLGSWASTRTRWATDVRRCGASTSKAMGRSERDRAGGVARLRKENTELRMQTDVLRRSVALCVHEAMGSNGGYVHGPPEGPAPDPARHRVSGARGQPGVVLQVTPRRRLTPARPPRACTDHA
jgi:transposase